MTNKDPAIGVDSVQADESADTMPDEKQLQVQSEAAADTEHALSVRAGIRSYRPAVFWSLFFCLGQLMTSFDPQILSTMFAMPAFQRDFGYLYDGQYVVSAPWQTGLAMGLPIGLVLGALAAGYPLEWYGRKKTMGVCVVGTVGCIFIQFFSGSLPVLLVGELLAGLILGFYAVISPTYASEVCPVVLRGILTSNINLFVIVGQVLATGVCAGTQKLETRWSYRIPFAMQWLWTLIVLVGLPFAPESPWWLVRKSRIDDARKSVRKMMTKGLDAEPILAMIVKTDRLERHIEAGSTYLDIFKRVNIRRTEICTGVYTAQVFSGIYLIPYGVYFFQQAGLDVDQAFNMGIGFLAIGILGGCLAWIMLAYFGRRTIYVGGLAWLTLLQLLIGILDCVPDKPSKPGVVWAQSAILISWNFFYCLTVGPVGFSILCETSAVHVREKTIAFATAFQAAAGIGMTVAVPYMINPDQANLQGKLGFFFGGTAALATVWAYFRVPETKGRTYEELDVMFEHGVNARAFRTYNTATVLQ